MIELMDNFFWACWRDIDYRGIVFLGTQHLEHVPLPDHGICEVHNPRLPLEAVMRGLQQVQQSRPWDRLLFLPGVFLAFAPQISSTAKALRPNTLL